jgi:hypothetical protein
MIFRKVIFNSKVNRANFIRNKQKYRIVNRRNFYSLPNGPDDPDYFMMFITALSSYFTLKILYKK